MQPAPIPKNEKERLLSLHALGLLDTKPEERFDRITRIATKIFHVPISTLTLVDEKREWFKSVCGLDQKEGDRAISFCGHALLANEIFVIHDTKKDKRFSNNPMVIGKPYIRFYAGVPIMSADGQRIGVFCVKDTKPRAFSKNDEDVLVGLAAWAELEVNSRNLSLALNKEREMRAELKTRTNDLENAKIAARNVLEDFQIEQQKLAAAKAKDEALLESIGEGIVAIDKDGKVILINKAAEELLEFTSQEMLGKLFVHVIPMQDTEGNQIPDKLRPITLALGSGKSTTTTTTTTTYYFVRKNGTKFPVAVIVTPIIIDSKITGAVVVFRDISKEKEIEKLRSDFLALASHQLRTPLSGTKWLIETMQRGVAGKLTPKQKEYMTQIYNINERMIKLVFDMLNVLRLESAIPAAKKKTFTLGELFKDILLRSETAAEARGIAIQCPKDEKTFSVETDFESIKSILECFISNAINYSHSGQEVVVDIKEEPGSVVFFVEDRGIGIPQDEQKRIFERFYRATNAKELKPDGTGLGLYMAQMLAERIGAKITFESEENKGSTFYLRISKKLNI